MLEQRQQQQQQQCYPCSAKGREEKYSGRTTISVSRRTIVLRKFFLPGKKSALRSIAPGSAIPWFTPKTYYYYSVVARQAGSRLVYDGARCILVDAWPRRCVTYFLWRRRNRMRISLSTRRGLLSPPLFSFASQLPAILITPPIQPYRYFVRFKRDLFSSFPFFQSDSEIDEKEINKRKEWRISLISNFKFRVEIVYKREREELEFLS